MTAHDRISARGPRWAISQRLPAHSGKRVAYAATAEEAEQIRAGWAEDGSYVVSVVPPEGAVDLPSIGRALAAARAALAEQTDIARAAALRAIEEGYPETVIARGLGVDRMTVRKWRGKSRRAAVDD